MNQKSNEFHPDHSLISPTAKLVAWWRTCSDIPFAREAAEYSKAWEAVQKMLAPLGVAPELTMWGAPILEIRYKSLLREIKNSGCKQVLEIASGISLRGLVMTEDPSITYLETDLPGITHEKIEIVRKITGKDPKTFRRNLRFAEANALDMTDLELATSQLDPKAPLAIVHEGLLHYFSRSEKVTLTRNVKKLLEKFGGVWISPDFEFRSTTASWGEIRPDASKVLDAIREATGRAMLSEAFESESELRDFMHSEQLQIEKVPQVDDSMHVTSAARSGIPAPMLDAIKKSLFLWKIRLLT